MPKGSSQITRSGSQTTNIGDALYSYRALHRMTGIELAQLIGISNSSIAKIEGGFLNFDEATMKKIMNWLLMTRPPRQI